MAVADNTVVIKTKLGQLKGCCKRTSLSNKTYYAFLGIPFAKPPIGELRFKAPQPCGGWEGVRDALVDGNIPAQAPLIPLPGADPNKVMEGDEDCLYLNVYTNQMPGTGGVKKPVMFSIHGGGFAGGTGASSMAGADYIVEQDVVLVTFNYRCGAFGFLSLENEEAPGNAGLKDQTLALEWVRDNIDSFGGDPKNVTIFGISAGGASVHFQLLSPLSKGLFHKAIIQSGFATNPWAIQKTPKANALKLAQAMGCNTINPSQALKFLQSVSSEEIIKTTKKLSMSGEALGLVFTPCVEVEGSNSFLSEDPKVLIGKGQFNKVPVILGNALREGSVILFFGGLSDKIISNLNANRELLVPSFLGLKSGTPEKKQAAEALWKYYMKGEPLSWDNANCYFKYQSDYLFNLGMVETRAELVKNSSEPVYTYVFSNHSKCFCKAFSKFLFPDPEKAKKLIDEETCHGADSAFLYTSVMFQSMFENTSMTDEYAEAIRRHTKAWANFALTGNPNSSDLGAVWGQDSIKSPNYMDIGEDWVAKEGVPFSERHEFWNQLITKYKQS